MNNRDKGSAGEEMACRFLEERGLRILERNFRCRAGEIDLIAMDGNVLVFAEVKYRRSPEERFALEAVNAAKQRRITRSALVYMMLRGVSSQTPCRFDVIGIAGRKLFHIKDAFGI